MLNRHYRILVAQVKEGAKKPTVGATTVMLDKGTGEFWLSVIFVGQGLSVNSPVQGKCLKH